MAEHSANKADTCTGNDLRQEYRVLTETEKVRMRKAKDLCQTVLDFMRDELGESRDLSIARNHLETASMWIVRHITK